MAGAQGLGALGMGLNQGYGQQAQAQMAMGLGQQQGIGLMIRYRWTCNNSNLLKQNWIVRRANHILQAHINQTNVKYMDFMSDISGRSSIYYGLSIYSKTYGQPGSPFSQMLGTGATATRRYWVR